MSIIAVLRLCWYIPVMNKAEKTKRKTRAIKSSLRQVCKRVLTYLLIALAFVPAGIFYVKVTGVYAALFLIFLLVTYSFFIALSWGAQDKLLALENAQRLDEKQGLKLALLICLPINWFGLIYALIPMTTFYAWMLTGFPFTVFSFIYMKVTADHLKRKAPFWAIQVLIYLTVLFGGQIFMGFLF